LLLNLSATISFAKLPSLIESGQMLTILKIASAILIAFIGLILFIIAAYFYLKRKFRIGKNNSNRVDNNDLKNIFSGFMNNMHETIKAHKEMEVPPFRIQIEKKEKLNLSDENDILDSDKKFKKLHKEFSASGLELIENYDLHNLEGTMSVFYDKESEIYAIIYNQTMGDFWYEAVRIYADGSIWTHACATDPCVDYPPNHVHKFFPDTPVNNLINQLKNEAPKNKTVVLDADTFAKYFKKAYASEMDWRIKRGGPTEEEIRRAAERDGNECPQEHITFIREQWRLKILEFIRELVLKDFRKSTKKSRSQWETLYEDAYVVHSKMTPKDILKSIEWAYNPEYTEMMGEEDMNDEDREQQEKWDLQLLQIKEDLKQNQAQQVFRNLVEMAPNKDFWEFQGTSKKPLDSDIWLLLDAGYSDDEEDE
jgi:hypothetical protein